MHAWRVAVTMKSSPSYPPPQIPTRGNAALRDQRSGPRPIHTHFM
jgi:hypothetical protein